MNQSINQLWVGYILSEPLAKHLAACIFLLKPVNHMEPHAIGPARFHRRQRAELLVFLGGCRILSRTQLHPTALILHRDVPVVSPEIEGRHGAGLSRYYRKISSVR
jgi:hypothetical protein